MAGVVQRADAVDRLACQGDDRVGARGDIDGGVGDDDCLDQSVQDRSLVRRRPLRPVDGDVPGTADEVAALLDVFRPRRDDRIDRCGVAKKRRYPPFDDPFEIGRRDASGGAATTFRVVGITVDPSSGDQIVADVVERLPNLTVPEVSAIDHGDLVGDAASFADQPSAGFELRGLHRADVAGGGERLGEAAQFGGHRLLQSTEGLLLELPGDGEFAADGRAVHPKPPAPLGDEGVALHRAETDEPDGQFCPQVDGARPAARRRFGPVAGCSLDRRRRNLRVAVGGRFQQHGSAPRTSRR